MPAARPTPAPHAVQPTRPAVTVVRPAGEAGLEVFERRGGALPAPLLSDGYTATLVDRGAGTVRYRGRDYPITGPALLLQGPDELAAWTSIAGDGRLALRSLHIDAERFERALASVRDARAVEFRRFLVADDGVLDRAGAAIDAAAGAAIDADLRGSDIDCARPGAMARAFAALVKTLGRDWMADCGTAGENAGPVCPGFVRRARQHLVDHARSRVTLADLERVTGRGRFEIIRGFKHAVGTTPHEFLVHTRVRHARRLLRAGHRPVDVAGWVGFFDQSHLNRHFKRLLGVTPARYRRADRRFRS